MAELSGTLLNYRTRVRRYLQETKPSSSYWSDAFINQIFNSSYRRRCSQLIMAFEGFFCSVATRDLVASQAFYAFPSGFQRMQKLELVRTNGMTVPIRAFERHEETNQIPTAGGDNYTCNYRPRGSGIVLEPAPMETVLGGLRMEYIAIPVELEADGDSMHPDFPTLFDELVVLDAACTAMDAEDMMEAAGQGLTRSLLRARAEWEADFERFIDSRVIRRQEISPFQGHYRDS